MSKAQPNKTSAFNIERERFSNFVVDLRQREQGASRELKRELQTEEKKVRRNWRHGWGRLEKKVKKIKPDLLTLTRPRIRRPSFAVKKLFGWRRPASPWQKFVQAQARIFNAAPRPPQAAGRRAAAPVAPTAESFPTAGATVEGAYRHRSFWLFILMLAAIIIIFKILSFSHLWDLNSFAARVTGRSKVAINSLVAAADSAAQLNLRQADQGFQTAGANFLAAENDLSQINSGLLSLAALSNNPQIKLAAESPKFLKAGQLTAALGHDLVLATDSLFNGDKNNFPATLDNFLTYGHLAVADAQSLQQVISQINPDNLPTEYRSQFLILSRQSALLADNLNNFVSLGEQFKEVLGLTRDKRYLLVFQNNAELRASGGFLGSYALVDISAGKIRNLEVPGGGSYDTEGGLSVRVAAPQPLWLVNPLWHFWDANWWPDWPKTAQNLTWFYGKSGGPSVDGVISVTPTVVERLLEITGPIDLQSEYGLTITSDNFWDTIQRVTEQPNLAKTHPEAVVGLPAPTPNKPKKIIGDLLTKMLAVLPQKLSQDNLLKIIQMFEQDMSEKQILLYFSDPQLEAEAVSRNWAGQVRSTDKDYLLVVNTNIAGQKSDRLMTEKIDQVSTVGPMGAIINTIQITRTHTGRKNAPLTGVRNVDWLRVYVPAGSELLSASGFTSPDAQYLQNRPDPSWTVSPLLAAENAAQVDPTSGTKIYLDSGKTVFANWVMVDPGQTAVITLKYLLPFNFLTPPPATQDWLTQINSWLNPGQAELLPYSLLVQKQPGAAPSDFSSHLILPENWQIIWRYPADLSGTSGWEASGALVGDKYWSVLLEKKSK
jgi:hypothetical protein